MQQTKCLHMHLIRYEVGTITLLYHKLVATFTTNTTQGAICFAELA
jgi:hypothetical protein